MNYQEKLDKLYREFEESEFYTGVVVINKDKTKVLLAKRTEDGIWTSPGGHPEGNETPQQAVVRELKEESDIDASTSDLNKLEVQKASDGKPVYVYYILVDDKKEKPNPKNDPDKEVKKWNWYKFDELPKGLTKDIERFISVISAIKKTLSYEEKLDKLIEAGNKLSLPKLISEYKTVYKAGDCLAASKKVVERVEGFKLLHIPKPNNIRANHYVAENGGQIVDLTFPDYHPKLVANKINTIWMDKNKNKVLFNKSDYLKNIKQ